MANQEIKINEDGQKFINLEPHWCAMFDLAVRQVKSILDEEEGRAFILEMLEFGKRLNEPYCKECSDAKDI